MDQDVTVATSNPGEAQTEEPTPEPDEEEKNMTILEHLEELRQRLIVMLIAVALATIASVVIAQWAFDLLMWPARANLPDFKPVYTEVTEMFSTYLKVALFSGIILSMPVLVYEIAAFIAPGLTDREKRYLFFLIPGVFIALVAGLVFGYFIVVPFAVRYLLGTDIFVSVANPMIKISNYIEFVTNLELAIGFSFELPIVVFFLSKVGVVNTRRLSSYRKYAILAAAVAAAIITPTPDPGTQMLVAVPLYFLYEIGILLSRIA